VNTAHTLLDLHSKRNPRLAVIDIFSSAVLQTLELIVDHCLHLWLRVLAVLEPCAATRTFSPK
jgi:hypothetical protein